MFIISNLYEFEHDRELINKEYNNCLNIYGINNILHNVRISYSKRLTSKNGYIRCSRTSNKIKIEIKISYHLRNKFGLERSLKTLRHELAHYVDFYKNGKFTGHHSKTFLDACKKLGGSLTFNINGYEECYEGEDNNYTEYKWEYKCQCRTIKVKRRYSTKELNGMMCRHCKTLLKDMKFTFIGM